MRKVVLFLLSGLLVSICANTQTVLRFGADFTGNPVSYTFTPSADIAYANATGGTFSTSGSNLCSGALRRTQVSTLILKLVSSGASAISIPGQSSGSSLRTLTLLETAATLNGTYTTVPAASYNTSSTINSSSSCGVLDITNLNIASGTFVRFTFSGNISVSGFDITPIAATAPSTQATNIVFSNVAQTGMTIGWTRGNGANVAVFVKDGAGAITNPVDASTYTANTVFGSGTQLGTSGYYCVYNGTGTSVAVSGLLASHTYYVQAFEYNGLAANTKYLTTTAANNPNSQATLAPGADFRSAASGNWSSAATWETYNGSAWVAAASAPSNTDGVITIQNGHVVTVTANVSADELVVNSGGEIDVNNGITFTVANGTGTDITLNGTVKNTGTFTLAASATMSVASTGVYEDAQPATTGTITLPTATWSAGSTCKLTGLVGAAGPADYNSLQGVNQTFSNFIIDVPNLIGKLVVTKNAASNFAVSGTLTVNATGPSTYGVQLTSSGAQEAVTVGNYVQNGGIVSILHNSSNTTAKSLTVTGNFNLTGTSVFNISAYTTGAGVTTLSVGGNVSVAPTALLQRNTSLGTGGTTNMVFNGSSAQAATLVTAGAINYTLNNAAGLTIGSDITANGTLTFTAGNITTGSNKVIISSTGSMVNAGTGGWVAGNLQKNIATGATSKTFEVGDATGYRPAAVAFGNVTVAGDLVASASQTAGDHSAIAGSGLDAGKTVNRFWSLVNNGITFDQYDVTFTFLAGDVDGGSNTSAFLIKKYNGSAWSSTTAGTRTATTTQATGVTSFSDFAIGEAAAVGAPPTVSTQPNSGSICTGSNTSFTSASLSSPAPSVQWERSTNGTLWVTVDGSLDGGIYSGFATGTLIVTGATAGINGYQYRAVFTNVNGTVNSNAATLTVDPASVGGTAAGTQTICSGTQPTNLTLSGNTGNVVKWQKATDAVFTTPVDIASSASATLTSATIGNLSATTYFRAVVKSGACANANSSVVTVTVNPLPAVTTANTASVCSGAATNISLTASVASTFSWTIGTITGGVTGATASSGSSIAQTLTNPSNATAGTVEYIVTPTSTGSPACAGAAYTITVTVNPKPVVTTANTGTICNGTATNIALTASANSTFSWTIGTITGGVTGANAGSGSTIAQTLLDGTNTTAGTLEYLVTATATAGSCVSAAPYTITITVNPTPVVTTPNTAAICSGDITNISLTSSAASTFTWTVGTITGGITGASGGAGNKIAKVLTNPSTSTSGTVQFLVTPTSTATPACPGPAYTITVTVNPGSGGLAGTTGGISVCASHDVATSPNYYSSCDLISTITPAGATPVTGNINTCAKIDAAVNVSMPYVQRTFIVTATATNTANVTLYFLQSEFNAFNAANGSFGDLPTGSADAAGKANMRISVFTAASHTPGATGETVIDPTDANIVFNSAANRWEVTFATTFAANNSYFVHTNHWPLPVSLVDFKGEQTGASNKLSWSTATENNNKGFEVERSADGKNFSSIGFVASKAENGNSTSVLNYQLTDNRPFAGDSYYRLKQMDRDGKFAYSKVIMLGRKVAEISLGIYPNPVIRELNVVINAPKAGKITLVVTDLSGKTVMQNVTTVMTGVNQQAMNIEKLSAGSYIIKAICADGCETAVQRFVKQ